MTGRVIGRLEEIERLFRSGYKTQEVLALLATDGIRLHRVRFTQVVSRFGKSERQVRARLAAESGAVPAPPRPATERAPMGTGTAPVRAAKGQARSIAGGRAPSTATVALRRREQSRERDFRPDPHPVEDDLVGR